MAFVEDSYLVAGRETDCFGYLKSSVLLSFLQDTAVHAAAVNGFDRDTMLERHNAFWVVIRMWYHLDRPIQERQTLTVRTFHRPVKSFSIYRDFDLFADGVPVGEAVSEWVLCDQTSREIIRMSGLAELQCEDGGALCKTRRLKKLHLPEQMHPAGERTFYYSDTDINRHVNNTRYADVACDAVELFSAPEGSYICEMQLTYSGECRPGETILLEHGTADGTQFVRGSDKGGKTRFDAALTVVTSSN